MSDKNLWLPCHTYIARNISSDRDILSLEKSLISTMAKFDYSKDEIQSALDLLPTCLSANSPIAGRPFDLLGTVDLGDFIDSIMMDSSIPSYKNCRDYYKTISSRCEVCPLCKHHNGYRNRYRKDELRLVRFIYENDENFEYLSSQGLSAKVFRSVSDLFDVIQSNKPLIFELNKFFVRTLIECGKKRHDLYLTSPREESYKTDLIGKSLIRSLRNRSLPTELLMRGWELKYGAVLYEMIGKVELCSKTEACRILSLLNTPLSANTGDDIVERNLGGAANEASVKDISVFNNAAFADNSDKTTSDPERSESGTSLLTLVAELEDDEERAIQDDDARGSISDSSTDNSRSDDKVQEEKTDASIDSGQAVSNILPNDQKAVLTENDYCDEAISNANVDFIGDEEYGSDHEGFHGCDLVGEHAGIPTGDQNMMVPISEVYDENGVPLNSFHSPSEDVFGVDVLDAEDTEVVESISVESRTVSAMDSFVYSARSSDDLIYIPTLCEEELSACGMSLDIKNVTLLTQIEAKVLKNSHLYLEIAFIEGALPSLVILIYEPYSSLYYYTTLSDQMTRSVLLPILSSGTIVKVCFSPQLLYSFARSIGAVIKNVHSIQEFFATTCQYDRYDYLGVMEYYKIRPHLPERLRKSQLSTPVFYFMTGYSKIYREQMRFIAIQPYFINDVDARAYLSEALSYAYMVMDGKPLFKEKSIFHYSYRQLEQYDFDGYCLHYRIISEYISSEQSYMLFGDVLAALAEKGRFRTHNIYVIDFGNELSLLCETGVFSDLLSWIDLEFVRQRNEYGFPYLQTSLQYRRVYPLAIPA